MIEANCIFCQKTAVVLENDLAKAFWDIHPVRKGHLLVVPKQHYATYFDVPPVTRQAMDALVFAAKDLLDTRYAPAGYNIGINSGAAAGQTVMHAHIHVIPRYIGDVRDPRGGIRKMLPHAIQKRMS
ncbi:HIT family protein [Levilactobacillus brevis]|uniref:Histidine triad domain protein n=2 Tax=Levilactobacillus brevis TaxID=1580 RepID=U2P288_LEVBR|nr:HIT family protein [Levilactobacillus brevis]ERK44550.1 histidine triad domain protein [Levilactobacillus brevis ATCC 14869 = DSM 20054]KID44852.1 Bis(5'-nucleosyl)-tetraphosphatase (asymmetrical) [Levilactobacillus brevis]KIO97604.1 Bis(5'-nucleosyl)-tetraphosphatase (asymmetrical) [Levilactobacillus brevis]KRK21783.1 diadenosine tetraphosphate (Ap4A) hydrolase [Levilactobacillus brevis ATCC 14869 = DSM 20054]MBS0946309.1 HIT family protein [Levilactobacillus brevis]